MTEESPVVRAARLGAFLDRPPRREHDDGLVRETRYTIMGLVTMAHGSTLPIALCKSCCVLVPDQKAYLDVHEQRMHQDA